MVSSSYNNVTWLADIAIVTVNEPFEYQLSVGPACLQFNENLSGKYPKNGAMAMVAAWGPYMENKTVSKVIERVLHV